MAAPSAAMCLTCRAPLTTASAPKKKASAARAAGPQEREGVDRAEPEDERDRGGERVLAQADAGLAVQEGVVERVQQRRRRARR